MLNMTVISRVPSNRPAEDESLLTPCIWSSHLASGAIVSFAMGDHFKTCVPSG